MGCGLHYLKVDSTKHKKKMFFAETVYAAPPKMREQSLPIPIHQTTA